MLITKQHVMRILVAAILVAGLTQATFAFDKECGPYTALAQDDALIQRCCLFKMIKEVAIIPDRGGVVLQPIRGGQ